MQYDTQDGAEADSETGTMLMSKGTYFFTLSAGIPMDQKANEASPPDKKLASGVLICKAAFGSSIRGTETPIVLTSYGVP